MLIDYFRQYLQENNVGLEWAALMILLIKAEDEKHVNKIEKYYAKLQKYPDNYFFEIIRAGLDCRFYGNLFKARDRFFKALDLLPESPYCYYELGYIYHLLWVPDKSRSYYEKGLINADKSHSPEELKARCLYNIAFFVITVDNEYKEARKLLKQALKHMPAYPQARQALKLIKKLEKKSDSFFSKKTRSLLEKESGTQKRPVLEAHWLPTEEVSHRVLQAMIEFFYNSPQEKIKGKAPYELLLTDGNFSDIKNFFDKLPEPNLYNFYQKNAPLKSRELDYTSVYNKSGGLLNLFNPRVNSKMDKQFQELMAQNNNEEEAMKQWKETPSELWSSLPPQLVWAGGGPQEQKLFKAFLDNLNLNFNGQEFFSEGNALLKSMSYLRQWQVTPNHICNGKTPQEAIIKERNEIYKHKSALLKGQDSCFAL